MMDNCVRSFRESATEFKTEFDKCIRSPLFLSFCISIFLISFFEL